MHQLILNQSECNLMQRSNSNQANLHQLTEMLSSIRFAYTQIQMCGHNLHLFVAASSERKRLSLESFKVSVCMFEIGKRRH